MTNRIPKYHQLIQPTLDAIRAAGGRATNRMIFEAVSVTMQLGPDILQVRHKAGQSLTEVEYRLMWARTYLRKTGYIDKVQASTWVLTELGQQTSMVDAEAIVREVKHNLSHDKIAPVPVYTQPADKTIPRNTSRNALFRTILREANAPLHFTEIHRRALAQLSEAEHFSERLTYAGLYASPSIRLLGDGMFGLQEWDIATTNSSSGTGMVLNTEGEWCFSQCPQPLIPEDAHPRAFFDSIMLIKQLVYDAPHLTARQIYLRLREWARRSVVQTDGAQEAFNAWYCAGVCEYIRFDDPPSGQPFHLTLPDTDDIADLRTTCLQALLRRVDGMPHLLTAMAQIPVPTVSTLRTALESQPFASQSELVRRLNLLLAFEAVRRDGDVWRLTRSGEALQTTFPDNVLTLYQADNGVTMTRDDADSLSSELLFLAELEDDSTSTKVVTGTDTIAYPGPDLLTTQHIQRPHVSGTAPRRASIPRRNAQSRVRGAVNLPAGTYTISGADGSQHTLISDGARRIIVDETHYTVTTALYSVLNDQGLLQQLGYNPKWSVRSFVGRLHPPVDYDRDMIGPDDIPAAAAPPAPENVIAATAPTPPVQSVNPLPPSTAPTSTSSAVLALPIEHLTTTFKEVSNSYKFLWLLAMLRELDLHTPTIIPIQSLLERMVAIAWALNIAPPATSKPDVLARLLEGLRQSAQLPHGADEKTVLAAIIYKRQHDTSFAKDLLQLGAHVPYRFIRPFLPGTLRAVPEGKLNQTIIEQAVTAFQHPTAPSPYRFSDDPPRSVEVHPTWAAYLRRHSDILRGYTLWSLHLFLESTGRPDHVVTSTLASGAASIQTEVLPAPTDSPSADLSFPDTSPLPASGVFTAESSPDTTSAAEALHPVSTETPSWTHPAIRQHMYDAIAEAVQMLFPLNSSAEIPVLRHDWRNPMYVGEIDGRPVPWRGWSVNLTELDEKYGTLYIDISENVLPAEQRYLLFGKHFSERVSSMDNFIVAYVAGIPLANADMIEQVGYTVRLIGKSVHACIVVSPEDFLASPVHAWAGEIVRLANLKRMLLRQSLPLAQMGTQHNLSTSNQKDNSTQSPPTGVSKWLRAFVRRS